MTMELNLVSRTLIPEDAVISIRAGSVRRQSALSAGRPFRFPQLSPEANPVKIDILKPVGSAYLVLKPGEQQYKITFDGGMGAEVEVKHVDANKPAAIAEEPRADSNISAKEAKDYLDRHQVLPFVQSVIQTVLKDLPEDPFVHIAKHFLNGYLPESLVEKVSVKPDAPNVTQSETKWTPADGDRVAPKAGVDPVDSLRKEAANSLLRAAEDGTLEKALATAKGTSAQDAGEESIDALRKEAASSLMRAAEDGTLESALANAKGPPPVEEQAAPASGEDALDSLRKEAASSLLRAAEDGTLEKALATAKGKGAPVADEASIDALRKEAASSLLRAAEDGTLESALANAKGAPPVEEQAAPASGEDALDSLRKEAASSLLRAAEDGTLEKALATAKGKGAPVADEASINALRQEAVSSLLRAAEDGTLESALPKATAPSAAAEGVDDLRREQAASVLSRAAEDGSLEEALTQAIAEEAAETI